MVFNSIAVTSPGSDKGRIVWVDWAKALAILMMVLGHGTAPDTIIKYVYAFHMPAFFIISGYLYKPKPMIKILKAFGIPVLVFGFINYCFTILVEYRLGGAEIGNISFKSVFLILLSFPGFWFVRTLFFARLLSGDIISKTWKYTIPTIGALFLLLIIAMEVGLLNHLPNWLRDLVYSYPFFAIGYMLKQFNFDGSQKTLFLVGEALVFIIVPCLFEKFDLGEHQFGPTWFLFLGLSVPSSLLFFSLCNKLPSNKMITLLSEGTLLILGVHKILLKLFYQVFKFLPFEWLFSLIAVTIVCWWLVAFCKKKCPYLLGK